MSPNFNSTNVGELSSRVQTPGALYDLAMAQDGARIVPDDELRARWVAE